MTSRRRSIPRPLASESLDSETTKHKLEDYLRRYGLLGEQAFHAIAYVYVELHQPPASSLPDDVVEKWRQAHKGLPAESHAANFIESVVAPDRSGHNLPDIYQFFVGRKFREASGKFFTPRPIARAMAQLLPLRPNPVIMDPTCGAGTFLLQASARWGDLPCTLVANDSDKSLVELAMLTLSLGTPSSHSKRFLTDDIFEPTSALSAWSNRVDYMLANPPFSLSIDYESFQSPLFLAGYRNSDALFLDTALRLLRPGGRLICLLPHSLIANREFQQLRAMIEQTSLIRGVISLPEGVFYLSAGTTTRADILILEKTPPPPSADTKILFSAVPTAGVRLNGQASDELEDNLQQLVTSDDVKAALDLTQAAPR